MNSNVTPLPEINVIVADDHPIFRKGMNSTLQDISFIGKI